MHSSFFLLPICVAFSFLFATVQQVQAQARNQTENRIQTEKPTATAVEINQPPVIDGLLDEGFWNTVPPVTDFVQREPEDGTAPSERTEVRIAFDEHFLYFGMQMYDSEPQEIRRTILQRDGMTPQDDRIMIGLDTYGDRRNGYIFEATPLGTQGDAIITDESSTNWNWEGVFWSEARVTPEGWTLELAIPFSTLRYSNDETDPVMGLALFRSIRRKSEEVFWPAIGRNYRGHISQVSQYGTLVGLRNLRRSRSLQVKPYVLLGRQVERGTGAAPSQTPRDIGFDVRYAVTPNTTVDLTVNTDFAQVEADNAQINLTRFSLFYPEKREFFLERNGLFAFGVPPSQGGFGGPPLEAATFFSRRMGLNQPILAGGRVSGKSGPVTYGVLNLQTGDEDARDGANYGVVRARLDLTPRRSVGAIVTNVEAPDGFNRAAGADLAFRFFRSSSLTGWVSRVWTPQQRPSSAAGSANLLLRNDRFSVEGDYLNVGRNFDPAIGFVRRFDMVRYKSEAGWYPRPSTPWIRQYRFVAGGFYIEGQDGVRQSTNAKASAEMVLQSQDNFKIEVTRETDRPKNAFAIAGVPLSAGHYDDTFTSFSASSDGSRRVYANIGGGTGTLYGGDRRRIGGGATVKISPNLRIGGNVERNRFRFPVENGKVETTLVSLNAFVGANRKLYSNWLVQYDNVSKELQMNVRIRLLYRPGSDFYLVINNAHRFESALDPHLERFNRRAIVTKLTYMLAL